MSCTLDGSALKETTTGKIITVAHNNRYQDAEAASDVRSISVCTLFSSTL
jgi:hypothetical protein